jgi:hypothetical protein
MVVGPDCRAPDERRRELPAAGYVTFDSETRATRPSGTRRGARCDAAGRPQGRRPRKLTVVVNQRIRAAFSMSLAGKGAVAIWHDVADEGRRNFYAWHGNEHMPERAGIPGFLRGRRYVAVDGSPEFFNLYETVSRFTVTGADYAVRLNAPTPWTTASVRHFRNVARSLCDVRASFGNGQGGLIATLRYTAPRTDIEAGRDRLARSVLPELAVEAGVAGCHLLVADEAASAVETEERKLRPGGTAIPRDILLVEGWGDVETMRELCTRIAASAPFGSASGAPDVGIYRLQNSRCALPWSIG